jgi:hypothetical protein
MSTSTIFQALPLLAALVCCSAVPLRAQEQVEVSGEIKAMRGNRLEVQAGERVWTVIVDSPRLKESKQRTEMEFHGRGHGSIVTRGMWVRFFAHIDPLGKGVGLVDKLTWFTPGRNDQEGAFPVEPGDGEPHIDWEHPRRSEIPAGQYWIVGSVRSMRDGYMQVIIQDEAGRETPLLVRLAPDVAVEIHLSHKEAAGPMLARGDKVEIRGRVHENQLHALSLVARREQALGKPLPPPREESRPATPKAQVGAPPAAEAEAAAEPTPPNGSRARILRIN